MLNNNGRCKKKSSYLANGILHTKINTDPMQTKRGLNQIHQTRRNKKKHNDTTYLLFIYPSDQFRKFHGEHVFRVKLTKLVRRIKKRYVVSLCLFITSCLEFYMPCSKWVKKFSLPHGKN